MDETGAAQGAPAHRVDASLSASRYRPPLILRQGALRARRLDLVGLVDAGRKTLGTEALAAQPVHSTVQGLEFAVEFSDA